MINSVILSELLINLTLELTNPDNVISPLPPPPINGNNHDWEIYSMHSDIPTDIIMKYKDHLYWPFIFANNKNIDNILNLELCNYDWINISGNRHLSWNAAVMHFDKIHWPAFVGTRNCTNFTVDMLSTLEKRLKPDIFRAVILGISRYFPFDAGKTADEILDKFGKSLDWAHILRQQGLNLSRASWKKAREFIKNDKWFDASDVSRAPGSIGVIENFGDILRIKRLGVGARIKISSAKLSEEQIIKYKDHLNYVLLLIYSHTEFTPKIVDEVLKYNARFWAYLIKVSKHPEIWHKRIKQFLPEDIYEEMIKLTPDMRYYNQILRRAKNRR